LVDRRIPASKSNVSEHRDRLMEAGSAHAEQLVARHAHEGNPRPRSFAITTAYAHAAGRPLKFRLFSEHLSGSVQI